MAESIVPKFPSKESNKTGSKLDYEIYQNEDRHRSPEIIEPARTSDEDTLIINGANVCYLPNPAGILEETVLNLTRLHEDLCKIQGMLVKGGGR